MVHSAQRRAAWTGALSEYARAKGGTCLKGGGSEGSIVAPLAASVLRSHAPSRSPASWCAVGACVQPRPVLGFNFLIPTLKPNLNPIP